MESIGFIIRRNIEALEMAGLSVSEMRSSGGGSKSPLWNQIKSDIIKKPLVTVKCSEAACLGAAILAGTAVKA
jgi:xylulokinase